MSYQNFSPKLYQSGVDMQYHILSKSQQQQHHTHKSSHGFSATASDYGYGQGGHLPTPNNHKLNQVVMNDTSDIFNDGVDGGGVEPSINESIRQSIQCSFVSSECAETKHQYQMDSKPQQDVSRNNYVMNRMNWITYLKVLFDQLETFNQNKQKHVETSNFIKGLKKIQNLLPMQTRNDYYKNCSEVAFTYKEVENGVNKMPQYITWDNVIDIFLTKSFATQVPSHPTQAFQQLSSDELYHEPQQVDDIQPSDDYYEEVDVDQSYHDRYQDKKVNKNSKQAQIINKNSISDLTQQQQLKSSVGNKNREDFYPSFADSLINIGNVTNEHNYHNQHYVAHAPLLQNPNIGIKETDEDEACEIDSEFSAEESKNTSQSRRQRSKLEESVGSSRTATFKSIRRTSTYQTANLSSSQNQHSQLASALSQAVNVQDSYYQQIKNSAMPQNYSLQPIQQQQYYYQQQQSSTHSKQGSKNSKNNYYLDDDEDQVEVASNHSFGSQNQLKTIDSGTNRSLRAGEENQEKSTRLSSLNSGAKIHIFNQNNTIISQDSSQSSQKNHNNSKIQSSGQNSTSIISQSVFVDLDLQGKNLKNFEIDYKTSATDKRQLRSVNFANNNLIKLPTGLDKSLQYMNISYNKLKSLNGIESCVNLKFLNASGNQLSSANNLILLQSMRELIFSYNQISLMKEIGQLKNMQLLDVSFNKIIEFEKLIPLQNCKKMTILSLQGNLMQKVANYESAVSRMLPQVKVLDPDSIRDFSQFQQMEHVCFTDPPDSQHNISQIIILEQFNQLNLQSIKSADRQYENKQRPRTPNKDRPSSQISKKVSDSKLKANVLSPQKYNAETQNPVKGNTVNLKSIGKQQISSSNRQQTASNENQSRIQNKHTSSITLNQNQVLNNKSGKGNMSQRSSKIQQVRVQEQNQDNKSQNRDRQLSDLSRNHKQQLFNTSSLISGRIISSQTQNNTPFSQLVTSSTLKEPQVKQIMLGSINSTKTYGTQGRITPRKTNFQTPRQEIETHYYKKSFCTEDEMSGVLSQKQLEKELMSPPSELNTLRTENTLDSKNKTQKSHETRVITNKDQVNLQNTQIGIISASNKVSKAPAMSIKNANHRPVTALKQRVMMAATKDLGITQTNYNVANNYYAGSKNQQSVSMLQGKASVMPQSTKNNSQSFVFENNAPNLPGRQSPNDLKAANGRPQSQLQKFISASNKSGQQTSISSSRPSTTLTVHHIPSQKMTNLPPKAYQIKTGNPGDKKSKSDMSLSIISNATNNQTTMGANVLQTRHQTTGSNGVIRTSNGSGVMQTGVTIGIDEEESNMEYVSSRSMSPVLEESNNIKKLKVDLTQFMNKQ